MYIGQILRVTLTIYRVTEINRETTKVYDPKLLASKTNVAPSDIFRCYLNVYRDLSLDGSTDIQLIKL